jgi:putative oxidoreductase
MRLTWGHQALNAGIGKLSNITNVILFFEGLHIPFPHFNAYLVGIVETFGGAMLMLGLGSRLAAIPLAITMLVALSTAHAPDLSELRFLTDPNLLVRQAPYPLLITSLLVLVFGPGRVSLDALIRRWAERRWY